MFYAGMGAIAALIHIIINNDVFRRLGYVKDIPAHREYRRFLFAVLAYFITDCLWGVLDAVGNIPLLYADTLIYFAVMALAVLLWTRYVIAYLGESSRFTVFLHYAGLIFFIWSLLVLLFNCFLPICFYFDESGSYHASWARYNTLGLQFLLFLYTALFMLILSLKAEGAVKARYRAISFFGIAMTLFIIFQILYPTLPLYSVAYLLGTCLLHAFVVENEKEEYRHKVEELSGKNQQQERDLGEARRMVYTDPLTGVKSKHAYVEAEYELDRRIAAGELRDFAVAVFDLNDLKRVNDTLGHEEGDQYIRAASSLICRWFKHSPVYRIGGDEFAAFLQGEDFENRAALVEALTQEVMDNLRKGKVVVSTGLHTFDPKTDNSFRVIFEHADRQMYARKKRFKELTANPLPERHEELMEKYRFSEEAFRLMEESTIPFAVYQFLNKRVVTLVLSAGFRKLFGYTDKAQAYYDMDNDMYKDTHPDDVGRISDAAFRFATEGGRYETIYRSRNGEGGYRIIHAQGEHVHTPEGVRLAQVWYTDEGPYVENADGSMSELSQSLTLALHRESVLTDSYFDHLTGLPIMSYFFDLADMGSRTIRAQGGIPVLLFLDLNGLGLYTRTHGQAEGDKLLQRFARLLVKHFSTENCCRSGEDRFAVFSRREGIEDTLETLFREWQEVSHLPVRAGIYEGWTQAVDVGTACDRAKFACESMKDALISGIRWYDEGMQTRAAEQRYIASHLEEALDKGWIQVYYQPIIRAATGMVCSEEALARWINPEAGTLNPDTFIPPLEEAGLIYQLDLRVVELALEKLRTFRDAGHNVVPQSVNLSRADFDTCDMVEEIRRRVDEAGVPRSMLIIEITESVVGKDFEFMKKQVERFRELGFPVWMDDFGSGYSSLDVLQGIEFDLIKFDMHFMREFRRGSRGQIVLTELLKLVSALGLDAVCEGVETQDQAHFLREIGCSKLQGYYFSKPLPMAEVLELADGPNRARLEDPRETGYYETLGKMNLFDLGTLAYDGAKPLRNVYNTLPMAVLEVQGDIFSFIRTTQSYRDFMKTSFGIQIEEEEKDASLAPKGQSVPGDIFRETVRQCCRTKSLAVFDGKLKDGFTAHYYLRYVGANPVSGAEAVIVAVLSIKGET